MARRYLEFFAGGGMARAGLQPLGWQCVFANDFDFKKGVAYRLNWNRGGDCGELRIDDVRNVRVPDLPDAELAWASFPCQDLSLAGNGAGLGGERSGTFYPFWELMKGLVAEKRGPRIIALENVTGTLTSHGGSDFEVICSTFAAAGYNFGALVIDAALFVPQSRPRLFVVGVRADVSIPAGLASPAPLGPFHTRSLVRAQGQLSERAKARWQWWNLPMPQHRTETFSDIVEEAPDSVHWHSAAETAAILAMMSPVNAAKVAAARRAGRRIVGTVYKRTRPDEHGHKVQRAEVRFDEIAGCLRTPAGGSSRQTIMVVHGDSVRTRLVSSRETARLMGLPDSYRLPARYNEAYHLTGDGVVVPVVDHLAKHLVERLLPPAAQQAAPARRAHAEGMTAPEVAAKFKLPPARVHAIVVRALEKTGYYDGTRLRVPDWRPSARAKRSPTSRS